MRFVGGLRGREVVVVVVSGEIVEEEPPPALSSDTAQCEYPLRIGATPNISIAAGASSDTRLFMAVVFDHL
jgi:hypothetical protein